jgi:hypothetical protein
LPLQLQQNLNLLLLLIWGYFTANFYLSWGEILAVLLFTLVTEHLFLYLNRERDFYLSFSALSTSISVVFLLYASSLWIYFILISLALAQKHFLVFKKKHLFNPSNFVLIMGLLLFYDQAHLLSSQLGDNILLSMVASVLALSTLVRARRWVISLSFIFFYLSLQYFIVVGHDLSVTFESIYVRFYSITFVLFIYFMLTDPPTTPNRWQEQLLFSFLIAFSSVFLDRYFGYRVQHLFMMLFFFSFLFNAFALKLEFKRGVTILLLIIVSLVWIELQPPYYFEMNG